MISLSNRVHTFARLASKEKLIALFTTILGCEALVIPAGPGLPTPAIAFRFPGGGSLSFEFTEDALDAQQSRRGAYLELQAGDPAALQQQLRAAGLPMLAEYSSDGYFYCQAPGGLVLRIVGAGAR